MDNCKRQDQKEDIKISKSLALARMLYEPSFVGARRVDFFFVQRYATMHYMYPTVRLESDNGNSQYTMTRLREEAQRKIEATMHLRSQQEYHKVSRYLCAREEVTWGGAVYRP